MKKLLLCILLLLALPLCPARAQEPDLREGDRVVIWEPDTGLALSVNRSGKYQTAVAVTLTGDTLTGYTDAEVWTLTAGDSGWVLTCDGHTLSMAARYSYLYLDEVNDQWTVTQSGEDFTLTNTARGQLLSLNKRREQWYTQSGASSSGYTALRLTRISRLEPEVPDEPDEPEESEDTGPFLGLLHGHSSLCDGSLEPADCYTAAREAGLDFCALTDHSQVFDGQDTASLDGAPDSSLWAAGRAAAESASDGDFLALFAFEMAWNQGQGHIGTYFTEGFLSRDMEGLGDYAGGMEQYCDALLAGADSVSQLNHPGEDTEDFKGFSLYSPALDRRISLLEVDGNYDAWLRALDAGWHLAPTYGGGTHSFADEPGRTAVWAEALTAQALQEALTQRRCYATSDSGLVVEYFLEGQPMGSILSRSSLGSTVTLTARLSHTGGEALGTLTLLTQGGDQVDAWELDTAGASLECTLSAGRGYYFLKLTQDDGDWALTAPIWLDDRDDLGIAGVEPRLDVTTAAEPQTFRVCLYNNEDTPLTVTDLTARVDGCEYRPDTGLTLEPCSTGEWEFTHSFPLDGVYTLELSLTGLLGEEEKSDCLSTQVTVLPPSLTERVVVDGVHSSAACDSLAALAADQELGLRVQTQAYTAQALENCAVLLVSAPEKDWTADFVSQVRTFLESGGSLVLCGTAESQDAEAAGRLNSLAQALDLTGRFLAGTLRDETNNAGDPEELVAGDFADSPWTADLEPGQLYRQRYGCALDPGQGQWLVRGYATAGSPVLLCAEDTPWGGTVFFSGSCCFDDSHLHTGQSSWAQPTANQTVLETLLGLSRTPQAVIPIASLREAEVGRVYLAQGRITAGTANPNTAFPDTVYVQDDTGGIAAMPYDAHGLALGTQVRVLGTLEVLEGNPCLRLLRLTSLDADTPLTPGLLDTAPDYAAQGGQLLSACGTVTAVTARDSAVSRFTLTLADGSAAVFVIEDAIRSGSLGANDLARLVREGNQLEGVGLLHRSGGETVLRVRDCDEIRLLSGSSREPDADSPGSTAPVQPDTGENPPTGDSLPVFVLLLLASAVLLLYFARRPIWEW